MSNFNDRLTSLLKKDPDFLDEENNLLKNEVVNKAWKADQNLIGLLIEDEEIKAKFFSKIKDCYVFDINTFTDYIQDKHFLNDSYTKYKNKIGLTIDGKFLNERKEVALVWPYKDCILEGGQSKEDQKRKEIFFNEILAQDDIDRLLDPKVFTNFKKYTVDGQQKVTELKRDENGTIKENLIIKGNNLLALHSLKQQFQGKVKLIYIDPPFNTGNDEFKYNDNFNHSTWLTFMKNRLEVARKLLSEDGSIFIHLDYNESHYCKLLMDDIFGKDKFKNNIIWCYTGPAGANNFLPRKHDDILWYGKSEKSKFNMPYIAHKSGVHNTGQVFGNTESKDAFKEEVEARGKKLEDWWIDIYSTDRYRSEKIDFSGQKPEKLLQRIVEMCTDNSDIILDYHLGSGTTCAVAHKMGRQYIGIEQMNYIESIVVERMKKVVGKKSKKDSQLIESLEYDQSGISKAVNWQGGGDFIYCELAKYNQAFIDQIQEAKTTDELLKIWETMKERSFLNYNVDIKEQDKHIEEFKTFSLNQQKQILVEMLNKNQLYVNLSEIEDAEFNISNEDKSLNKAFYGEGR